ncbi:hypothetical protein [Anaeromassilibacillus sp. SJQ-1]|uniref:hypothetical protein n=1 Tax=Anaeromassilibacillus sp. SJQ-1 TaxID=3375419 RepID=UPI003989AD4D
MTKFERTIAKSDAYEISNIRVVMGSEDLERFNSYEEIQAATETEGKNIRSVSIHWMKPIRDTTFMLI